MHLFGLFAPLIVEVLLDVTTFLEGTHTQMTLHLIITEQMGTTLLAQSSIQMCCSQRSEIDRDTHKWDKNEDVSLQMLDVINVFLGHVCGCQLVQKDQIGHHRSIVDQVGNAVNDTKIHTSFFDHLLIGTGFFCVHVGHQNFMGPRKEDPQIQQISGQGNSQEKACMGRT